MQGASLVAGYPTESVGQVFQPDGQAGKPDLRVGVLQAALFIVSSVQFLRCAGPAYIWVIVGLIVPVLRLGWSADYRCRVFSQVRHEWACIEAFAGNCTRLPFRATFLLIVLPAG